MIQIEKRLINGEMMDCKCYYYPRKDNGNMNCRAVRPIRPRKPRNDKNVKREPYKKQIKIRVTDQYAIKVPLKE